jgi:hypothetical protein
MSSKLGTLSPAGVCAHTFWLGWTHSLAGERAVGGPNSDEGTDTVVLSVYKNFVQGASALQADRQVEVKITQNKEP